MSAGTIQVECKECGMIIEVPGGRVGELFREDFLSRHIIHERPVNVEIGRQ